MYVIILFINYYSLLCLNMEVKITYSTTINIYNNMSQANFIEFLHKLSARLT